jgi:hypothetical protein
VSIEANESTSALSQPVMATTTPRGNTKPHRRETKLSPKRYGAPNTTQKKAVVNKPCETTPGGLLPVRPQKSEKKGTCSSLI